MAVAALESLGVLFNFADQLKSLPNIGQSMSRLYFQIFYLFF